MASDNEEDEILNEPDYLEDENAFDVINNSNVEPEPDCLPEEKFDEEIGICDNLNAAAEPDCLPEEKFDEEMGSSYNLNAGREPDCLPEETFDDEISICDNLNFGRVIEQEKLSITEEVQLSNKFQTLFDIFPKGDLEYMRQKCYEYKDRDDEFEKFVSECVTNNNFPENEYDEEAALKSSIMNTKSLETFQYSLQNFINRYKDPVDYFLNCPRDLNYKKKVVEYLKDRFRIITENRIQQIAQHNNYNLLQCIHDLELTPPDPMFFNETPRSETEISKYINAEADDFLFEVEFVEHKEKILDFMKIQQEEKEYALEKGKILGDLLECECCFNDNVLAEDVVTCTNGHIFCNECFQRSVTLNMDEAKIEFPCFQECEGKFGLDSVKKVLSTQEYNKLLSRIQYREVSAAEIKGLEFCNYCDYAVVPAENDEIFNCEKCLAKRCRKCNKDYHYPRPCNVSEEEYQRTKARIESEERQTYSVVRICKRCNVDFIKVSGCNKMICSNCGAMMCYVCRQIISGYGHFDNNSYCRVHET